MDKKKSSKDLFTEQNVFGIERYKGQFFPFIEEDLFIFYIIKYNVTINKIVEKQRQLNVIPLIFDREKYLILAIIKFDCDQRKFYLLDENQKEGKEYKTLADSFLDVRMKLRDNIDHTFPVNLSLILRNCFIAKDLRVLENEYSRDYGNVIGKTDLWFGLEREDKLIRYLNFKDLRIDLYKNAKLKGTLPTHPRPHSLRSSDQKLKIKKEKNMPIKQELDVKPKIKRERTSVEDSDSSEKRRKIEIKKEKSENKPIILKKEIMQPKSIKQEKLIDELDDFLPCVSQSMDDDDDFLPCIDENKEEEHDFYEPNVAEETSILKDTTQLLQKLIDPQSLESNLIDVPLYESIIEKKSEDNVYNINIQNNITLTILDKNMLDTNLLDKNLLGKNLLSNSSSLKFDCTKSIDKSDRVDEFFDASTKRLTNLVLANQDKIIVNRRSNDAQSFEVYWCANNSRFYLRVLKGKEQLLVEERKFADLDDLIDNYILKINEKINDIISYRYYENTIDINTISSSLNTRPFSLSPDKEKKGYFLIWKRGEQQQLFSRQISITPERFYLKLAQEDFVDFGDIFPLIDYFLCLKG